MPSYSRKVQVKGKTAQELYDKIAADIDRFLSKTPIGKYDLDHNPSCLEVSFKSSMASATLRCTHEQLELDAKLSLLAAPFRSKLDEAIDRWIAKTFTPVA
jgi:hypothetical protein